MRPRCAVPAGEPPGELAVDCACKCAAKKLPAARSRRKSAGAARPVCCASQHNAGCTHRCAQLAGQQNAAQTTDRANERHHGFFKVPRMISCMVLSSQLGRSKRKNWTRSGLKKGPTLLEAPQGGHLRSHLRPENWVRPSGCVQLASHSWLHSLAALKDDTMFL